VQPIERNPDGELEDELQQQLDGLQIHRQTSYENHHRDQIYDNSQQIAGDGAGEYAGGGLRQQQEEEYRVSCLPRELPTA
jgi:hypothetical protein